MSCYFVQVWELKLLQHLLWRLPSFGMWHRLFWYIFTCVLEENLFSCFFFFVMVILPDKIYTKSLLILSKLCSSNLIYITFINSVPTSHNTLLLIYNDHLVRLVWENTGLPVLRKRKYKSTLQVENRFSNRGHRWYIYI